MSTLDQIAELLREMPCNVRVKLADENHEREWAQVIFAPVDGYIEGGGTGPVPMREVEWIDIKRIEMKHIGRLVPDKPIDHTEMIQTALDKNEANYEVLEDVIRIYHQKS
jgi:hypothetical protein